MSVEKDESPRIKTECSAPNEEDELDETKRKSRNLSEKKRRDQFNKLICELSSVVTSENRKVDKSTILKTAINNLKVYHQNVARAKEYEINEEWKPSFLTNEEYTYLMLQSVGGFIIVFSSRGKILYISNSLATVFGYSTDEVLQGNVYSLVSPADRSYLENSFLMCSVNNVGSQNEENSIRFCCQFLHKSSKMYEPVELVGHIKEVENVQNSCSSNEKPGELNKRLIFVGLVKLLNPMFYSEIVLQSHLKNEFISHHNFEWKFLFLDERAPSIIGYSPFELLGTSGYDYYHIDDLDNVTAHHRSLMVQDEGVSGYYRFMTKGHQWIWLQTTSYINRRHWNSRVEFVVCTHRVVNPWQAKSDHDAESKMLDTNRSYSSGSSTGTGCSNLASPPSWPSTTSESNYCEEDDGKEVGRVSRTYQEGFAEPEDTSLSSSQSSYKMGHYKKRKILRRHRVLKSANYSGSSDTSSNYTYSLTNSMASTPLENDVPPMLMDAAPNFEATEPNSTLEDALQKKCSELEQIIADRTEELRALSQQLYLARSSSQQNKDANVADVSALNRNIKPITFRIPQFMPHPTSQTQDLNLAEQVYFQQI